MRLPNKVKITDGKDEATVTDDGYLDVKTHTPEKCYTNDFSTAQTNLTIITPTSGKSLEIVSVYVSVGQDGTNVTLSFASSGRIVFKLYTIKKAAHTGNRICARGGVNESLKLTCPADCFISIGYDEA